ncbi:MAG: Hydrolase 4 protein [Patescibacteria group bacterium]|nr:alpha/beta hydrolase [Candidatus Saccharibacteria bacterium]MDQ5963627.1 Hydrolase 4 protein [Patescibacteria group bacterium]
MKKTDQDAADYIQPIHINGMNGRMLVAPALGDGKREILVMYGHHSSLERWWGLVQNLQDMGRVTMPDFPGFGGMDSFYKIGEKATIDDFADYMAAFVKMRYKRRRVSIVGISFGFIVAVRMLQKYPELAKKVDMFVSAVGFMHHDEFRFSASRMRTYRLLSRVIARPSVSYIFRYVALNKYMLRAAYARTHNAKHKFKQAGGDKALFAAMMDREIELWQSNDVRTHFVTTGEILTINNLDRTIDLPVWHIFTPHDNYFDNEVVEQHMKIVFKEYIPAPITSAAHAPSVIATKEEAAILIPRKLRTALRKS